MPSPAVKNIVNAGRDLEKKNEAQNLPAWSECDLFCIHDYAGTGMSRCGWRGRLNQAKRDSTGSKLLCPRCGSATLLRLPLNRADS